MIFTVPPKKTQTTDLVLDFVVAQHSKEELCEKHRRVVEAFRAARPVDAHGRRKFAIRNREDPLCSYVISEIEHHLRHGWKTPMDQDELALTEWLGDVPQDEIVISAGKVLGMDILKALATKSADADDCWLAGRYWSIASVVAHRTDSHASVREPLVKALDMMAKHLHKAHRGQVESLDDVYDVQLDRLVAHATFGQSVAARPAEVERVLASSAATRCPDLAFILEYVTRVFAALFSGNPVNFGRVNLEMWGKVRAALDVEKDDAMYHLLSQYLFCANHHLDSSLLKESRIAAFTCEESGGFNWDYFYGPNAKLLKETIRRYDFDLSHQTIRERFNVDFIAVVPALLTPICLHYGDCHSAREYTDLAIAGLTRAMEQSAQTPEQLGYLFCVPFWGFYAGVTDMLALETRATLAALVDECGLTWAKADETMETFNVVGTLIRAKHATAMDDGHAATSEYFGWLCKCAHVLISTASMPIEVVKSLPSLNNVSSWMGNSKKIQAVTGPWYNVYIFFMLVCMKYESWKDLLVYSDFALSADLDQGGCTTPTFRVVSLSLQGHACAALGQRVQAAHCFETAADEAHQHGLWLLEAHALRDLSLLVPDVIGNEKVERCSQQLGAILQLLAGPAEALAPMLRGLDARELMALK
eukprot:SAG31_NODE_1298_length_8922_cov_18.816956_6_plen_646_part_00